MRYLVVLMTVGLMVGTANATVVVSESFSHPLGNLVGQTPEIGGVWTAHSSPGLTPIQVVADGPPIGSPNSAQLAQGSGSREDANTLFANGEVAGPGEKFYAGFCVKATGTDPVGAVYFAHFSDTGTSVFTARVGVVDATADYRFAIFASSTGIAATYPVDYLFGTWHRVVTSWEYNTGTTKMWIDPDPALAEDDPLQVPSISATITNDANRAIMAYALRQASVPTGTQPTTETLDNLAVGTLFSEVASACIPEPATLGLLMMGGLAAFRRRR